jgi:hypothetical protein
MPAPETSAKAQPSAPVAKRRPDARPARVVLGLGAIAAMSIVTAGLVHFPVTDAADTTSLGPDPMPVTNEQVVHRVRYVQLKRGERPPKGAKVIRRADPTPRVVVRTVPAKRRTTAATRRRPVARTRQSGG